jgi:hypothetical protein
MKARLIVFAALALGPPLALAVLGVAKPSWMAIGAGAWAGSVAVKILLGIPVNRAISRSRFGPKTRVALWGAWSAFCELGAIALIFAAISMPASIGDVIGVGVGAGSLEIVVLVGPAVIALLVTTGKAAEPKSEPPGDWFSAWGGVFERISTSVGHVTTRGLVWVGLQALILAPAAAFAFATFALVDGVATYGHAKGWNWEDSRLYRRFNVFLALISLVEAAAFAGALALLSGLKPEA